MAPRKPKAAIPEDCMPKCRTCAFGEIEGEGGQCRRYPPAFVVEEGEVSSAFPVVAADDFCGEFRRKVNA